MFFKFNRQRHGSFRDMMGKGNIIFGTGEDGNQTQFYKVTNQILKDYNDYVSSHNQRGERKVTQTITYATM